MSWEQNPFKDDAIMRFFAQLEKVKDDSRSLILVTNGFLELVIETLIRSKCRNHKRILDDSRSYPYSGKLLLLNEVGMIPDSTYKMLDGFRKLRNRAAHEPFFDVKKEDLEFVGNVELRNAHDLHRLCMTIFGGFWNTHIAILGPVFAPLITGNHPNQTPKPAPAPPNP